MRPVKNRPTPKRRSYPWDQLADGGWYEAVEGEDYDRLEIFRGNLASWAGRNGYKYETASVGEGAVVFRIWKGE